MYHFVVYRKSNGAIARVITKSARYEASLVSLGFNPVLYNGLKVIARDRIEPSKWKVENEKLVRLVSKEEEMMYHLNSGKKNDEQEGLHIVFVGDATSANTGFGTQYKILKEGLERRGYKISQVRYLNIPQLIDFRCDFVLALSDYNSVKAMFDLGLDNLIYWFALESPDWPEPWNKDLKQVPYIVPLTKYGFQALRANEIKCDDPIAHGIDPVAFRPLPIRQRGILRKQNKVDNRFVISYLGTNVERKRLDLLIRSFALFVKEHDTDREALLILKTKVNGHYDIHRYVEQNAAELELENLVDQVRIVEKEMDVPEVAQLINISDLGFNATNGEGFCVPTIEYLMCGTPFLAGRHTSFPQLIGSHLPLVSVDDMHVDQRFKWVRYNIDPVHAAEIISDYYNNWKNNRNYDRQKLREIAMEYTTEAMIAAWDKYFRTLERKQIEDEFMERAATSLLNIETDVEQQRIYERASRAIDVYTQQSDREVKWIKVY